MRPYYLDGDLAQRDPYPFLGTLVVRGPVIPVFSRRLSMAADVASVQFSRTVEGRETWPYRVITPNCGAALR